MKRFPIEERSSGNWNSLDRTSFTRRRFIQTLSAFGMSIPLSALLAACGGDDDDDDTASDPSSATPTAANEQSASSSTPTSAASPATETASSTQTPQATLTGDATNTESNASTVFPVSIEHKYGTAEIQEAPQRVVSLGYSDQDAILALGIKPIAVRYWFGDQSKAVFPWAEDDLGDAEPEILNLPELDFELIASLNPDLIISLYSGITNEEYTTLAQIAPTIAQPGDFVDYGIPWQEQTRITGQALGKSEQAATLIEGLEARFAAIRSEHPEFEETSGAVAYSFSPGEYGVYGSQDPRIRFLTQIGIHVPDPIVDLAGDAYFATISKERLNLLDTDVLIWILSEDGTIESVESDELYQQLAVHTEGRDIFPDETITGALSFSTILSLPYALDNLVPMILAAIDGDPDTEVTS